MRSWVEKMFGASQESGWEREVMRRLDHTISRVLEVGMAISILLLLTGAVLALTGRGPSPSEVTALEDMPRALAALEPGGFLDLGLLVLLATPVVRVIMLAAGFARARTWMFFGISVSILGLLALSAYLGFSS